jgi:hypothetical protein
VAKLGGGKITFLTPAPPKVIFQFSNVSYFLLHSCPHLLKIFRSKLIKTLSRLRRRKKNYFAPPAVSPMTIWGKHRYVVRHISGHPPVKFGRRAGPGSAQKTGSKFGKPQKKLPHFLGDREKKVPTGSREHAAQPAHIASISTI